MLTAGPCRGAGPLFVSSELGPSSLPPPFPQAGARPSAPEKGRPAVPATVPDRPYAGPVSLGCRLGRGAYCARGGPVPAWSAARKAPFGARPGGMARGPEQATRRPQCPTVPSGGENALLSGRVLERGCPAIQELVKGSLVGSTADHGHRAGSRPGKEARAAGLELKAAGWLGGFRNVNIGRGGVSAGDKMAASGRLLRGTAGEVERLGARHLEGGVSGDNFATVFSGWESGSRLLATSIGSPA